MCIVSPLCSLNLFWFFFIFCLCNVLRICFTVSRMESYFPMKLKMVRVELTISFQELPF